MKVKLIQRSNLMDRDQASKYYAHMENEGVSDGFDILKDFRCKLKYSVKLKFMPSVRLKKAVG